MRGLMALSWEDGLNALGVSRATVYRVLTEHTRGRAAATQ